MTIEEPEQRLAQLEQLHEDASARLMVSEGLLSSIVRRLPDAAAVIEDFKVHHDYLEAASLNSSKATDGWIAKLQAAREVMLFRLSISSCPANRTCLKQSGPSANPLWHGPDVAVAEHAHLASAHQAAVDQQAVAGVEKGALERTTKSWVDEAAVVAAAARTGRMNASLQSA